MTSVWRRRHLGAAAPPPKTPPSFVSSASGTNNGLSMTMTVPATTQTGDVLLANVCVYSGDAPVSTPIGWTLLRSDTGVGALNVFQSIYIRVAAAGEAGTVYTWTRTGTGLAITGVMGGWRGASAASPVNAHAALTSAAAAFSGTVPNVTTTVDQCRLVPVLGIVDGSRSFPGFTASPGINPYGTNNSDMALQQSDNGAVTPAGTAGTGAINFTKSCSWVGVTVALQPA